MSARKASTCVTSGCAFRKRASSPPALPALAALRAIPAPTLLTGRHATEGRAAAQAARIGPDELGRTALTGEAPLQPARPRQPVGDDESQRDAVADPTEQGGPRNRPDPHGE